MTDLADAVQDAHDTELSRLGSSKAVYALTEGEMEDDVVVGAAVDAFTAAADAIDAWDGDVFADAASTLDDQATAIAGAVDDPARGNGPTFASGLANVGTDADDASQGARLGALLGWTLVADALLGQLAGYFVGQAAPGTADIFRDADDAVAGIREDAAAAIAAGDGDADAAESAAGDVVAAAYDEYFETLEELGVNPKPVC